MGTIDGLNNINCDELDSNVILFSDNLNGITPTVFNYLSGTTSNIQTQINSITGGGSTGSFTNLTVTNNSTLNNITYTGTLNSIGATTFSYLSGASSNIQTQINAVNNNLTNGTLNVVFLNLNVINDASFNRLVYTGTLNSITPTTFSYLSGASSNIQTQINNVISSITNGTLNANFSNLIVANDASFNRIVYTGTLNSITPTTFGYLSGTTSNIQTQINNVSNSITNGSLNANFSNLIVANDASFNRLVYTGTLNSITPLTFGYLSGTTSNIQTQINNVISSITNGTLNANFSNLIVANDASFNRLVYTGTLNSITPTTFGYLSGTTSNIQTQINNVISSITNGTLNANFSNLIVANDTSLNRVNVQGKFSVNYLNTVSVPALEVVCPSGVPANNYIGLYANIYGSPLCNDGGFVFRDNNTTTQGDGAFDLQDYTGRSYFYVNETQNSLMTCPSFDMNSYFKVNSYNRSSYPTLTFNKKVFEVYTDGGTGTNDVINAFVPMTCSRDITVNNIIIGTGGISYLAGALNTCVGKATLTNYINTTFPTCCGVGNYVLANCTTGVSNTAISNYSALSSNITGSSNSAVGNRVLENSLSSFNTGLGDSAGWSLTTGDYLTSCGYYSGYNITTGTLNCAFGTNAYATTNYSNSSAFGSNTVINGNNGTCLGYGSIAGANGTAIGYGCVAGANQIVLGTVNENVICPNGLTMKNRINFNAGSLPNNRIDNLNKLNFDNGYTSGDKIVLYTDTTPALSYAFGVMADTLYYNSPTYHKFFVNGSTGTPVLQLSSTLTTINTNLTLNAITLKPTGNGSTITFPSSIPTTTGIGTAGLGITWNDTGAGGGDGRTNFIGYGQGGQGGFSFTSLGSSLAPITNFIINRSGIYASSLLTASSGLSITGNTYAETIQYNNVASGGNPNNFGTINQNGTSLQIQSLNFNGTGAGATTIDFKPQTSTGGIVNTLSISSTVITANKGITITSGDFNTSGPVNANSLSALILNLSDYGSGSPVVKNPAFNANIFQQAQYMTIRSFNNGTPVSTSPTAIFFQTMGPSNTAVNNLVLANTEVQIPLPISLNYTALSSVNSDYLGGQKLGTYLAPTFTSPAGVALFSISLPIGVYNLCGYVNVSSSGTISKYTVGISLTSSFPIGQIVSNGLDGLNTTILQSNVNTIVRVTTTLNYYLNVYLVFTGAITVVNTDTTCFTATRIA